MDKDTKAPSLVAGFESEPVIWMPDGSPHNSRFNDAYRSRSGGVAQAESVFLAGTGLPAGWRGCDRFSVLETGFGLGLIEGLTKVFYPEASNVVIFVIMTIVLLIKPAGLFGTQK